MANSYLSGADDSECNSQRQRGNIPLNLKKCKENGEVNLLPVNGFDFISLYILTTSANLSPAGDVALYESLKGYILTEERLIESNFPVQHPEKPGCAVLFADNKRGSTDGE